MVTTVIRSYVDLTPSNLRATQAVSNKVSERIMFSSMNIVAGYLLLLTVSFVRLCFYVFSKIPVLSRLLIFRENYGNFRYIFCREKNPDMQPHKSKF